MKILQPHKPGCQAEQSKLCKAMDKKEALTRLRPTWQGTNAVDQVLALVGGLKAEEGIGGDQLGGRGGRVVAEGRGRQGNGGGRGDRLGLRAGELGEGDEVVAGYRQEEEESEGARREREEEVGRWEVKIQQREREREKGALNHRRRERAEPLGETLRQLGSQKKGRYRRQRERRHRRREGHLAHECRSSIVGRLARDREEEESWED
ncbi:hypothetical protein BHM03_00025721 [Ensete ventricosum]|nr:hypothetical protein BHM03_00025721 [Ensete ventricosum]